MKTIKQTLKPIYTDVDGTKYYQDARGDIVDKHGRLVSLTAESNIRSWMRQSHFVNEA